MSVELGFVGLGLMLEDPAHPLALEGSWNLLSYCVYSFPLASTALYMSSRMSLAEISGCHCSIRKNTTLHMDRSEDCHSLQPLKT